MNTKDVLEVKEIKGSLSSEEFYEKFKKNYLPSYDFFRLFFANLLLAGAKRIRSDTLTNFIREAKKGEEYKVLLADIDVHFNGVTYISYDIEENLHALQMSGVLGRSNPSFEIIMNSYSTTSAESTTKELDRYNDAMKKFVKAFIEFEKKRKTDETLFHCR